MTVAFYLTCSCFTTTQLICLHSFETFITPYHSSAWGFLVPWEQKPALQWFTWFTLPPAFCLLLGAHQPLYIGGFSILWCGFSFFTLFIYRFTALFFVAFIAIFYTHPVDPGTQRASWILMLASKALAPSTCPLNSVDYSTSLSRYWAY